MKDMGQSAGPAIAFGRAICGDLDAALRREWLVTNGIGGFAAGTIAGTHTRRYHGLLVAALRPPLDRTLLLAKLDEWAKMDGAVFPLACNEFRWRHSGPHRLPSPGIVSPGRHAAGVALCPGRRHPGETRLDGAWSEHQLMSPTAWSKASGPCAWGSWPWRTTVIITATCRCRPGRRNWKSAPHRRTVTGKRLTAVSN